MMLISGWNSPISLNFYKNGYICTNRTHSAHWMPSRRHNGLLFAPMLFQAALCLRNAGILDYLDQQGKQGAPLNAITEQTVLNEYAVSVLLDMGLSGRIITCKEGNYYLAKIGHYLLHDTMTRVNMDFTQDVCYQGLFFLADSLNEGKPSGLKVFGDW